MPLRLDALPDGPVRDFLTRVDRARGANDNGIVDSREAALATRRIGRYEHWRDASEEAFGLAPKTGAELLRFAKKPPRETALARILGQDIIAGQAQMSGGRGRTLQLAEDFRGRAVALTRTGSFTVDGKHPKGLPALSKALYAAAQDPDPLADATTTGSQKKLFAALSDALTASLGGRRSSVHRERLFSSATTLLIALAKHLKGPKAETLRAAVVDRVIQGIAQQPDRDLRVFYLNSLTGAGLPMDPAQEVALKTVVEQTFPAAPTVEAWTKNRTRPLQVRHTIHEEFWREEVSFYSAAHGWKLLKKNSKDSRREYERTIKDPTGKRPPLKVRVIVQKGELDFLDGMGDPNTHVILYSGHSSLGGNGSQAVADAPDMEGLPKLVFMANCRGKDNYPEFMQRFPEAMLITTRDPTYGDPEQRRVAALYDTLVRGEDFAYMRDKIQFRLWDEPPDNYFFPDEVGVMAYGDRDQDGRIDRSLAGTDDLFNVDGRRRSIDFVRAINFVNTEYFYHWEIDLENGIRSTFGREYADSVIADGPLEDPRPGEVVRVTPETVVDDTGKEKTVFKVQYDPADLSDNRDFFAGVVMANVAMAVAKDKFGELSSFEAMRAILMGAQAIYYLDVYSNTSPQTTARYFDYMGLRGVTAEQVNAVFDAHDAHANNPQTQAFIDMLTSEHGLAVADFVPKNGRDIMAAA